MFDYRSLKSMHICHSIFVVVVEFKTT